MFHDLLSDPCEGLRSAWEALSGVGGFVASQVDAHLRGLCVVRSSSALPPRRCRSRVSANTRTAPTITPSSTGTPAAARVRAHKEVSHLTGKRFSGTPREKMGDCRLDV